MKDNKRDIFDGDLFEPRKILDKGFVRLVDWMGDDSSIVQAARVSYGDGTKTSREDEELIDYLIRHQHTSPLEMVEFVFHIKLPLFVMGQLVRHRTASLNQMSARYSVMKDEFFVPEELRKQSKRNKQGSESVLDYDEYESITELIKTIHDNSYAVYDSLLSLEVSRELARTVLPQALYTEVYWKQDLKNLLHLLKLRMDSHAQMEIQEVARAIFDIIKSIVPGTINSWENHVLNAVVLSRDEKDILTKYITTDMSLDAIVDEFAEKNHLSTGRKREIKEKIGGIVDE